MSGDAFVRTLIADHVNPTRTTKGVKLAKVKDPVGLLCCLMRNPLRLIRCGAGKKLDEYQTLYTLISYMAAERMFMVTNTGFLGPAPKIVQPGDLICLTDGLSVPQILRKVVGRVA